MGRAKMKWKVTFTSWIKSIVSYLKDYRFSSILVKYFLLLFICLVLPVTVLSVWYGNQMRKNLEQELVKRNESFLMQEFKSVNAVIQSTKNLAYSLSVNNGVQYLSSKNVISADLTGNVDNLYNMLSITKNASDYIDSICIYFRKSDVFVSEQGISLYEKYEDNECLELYSENMSNRTIYQPRKKNNNYPYLLTILNPISIGKDNNVGAVIINIDIEKLGEYIGSGQYRNKDYSPMLLIFDNTMEELIYSDEYRMLKDRTILDELAFMKEWEADFSKVCTLWNRNYVVSGLSSQQDGLRYLYLTSMHQFELQNKETNLLLKGVAVLIGIVCMILASLLAIWVYKPVQHTIRVLKDVSMLTEWDSKERVDEIEAIQRSILSAKKEQENLNEQIQERIICLHNAQICALQTQINPHFLYNTLESIGNAAALLMKGNNKVTDMIFSLGQLMRISLSGENYLVPLEEELEHVKLYVELVDFRFRGRISMHIDLPEELRSEKIVKLTLQPLIENAIEHGLAKRRTKGVIWIRGEKNGDMNYIHVTDNGEGVSEEKLRLLQEQLNDSAINSSKHIGLRNVNQRLKLVFGDDFGLEVKRTYEGGLCVTICYKTI